MDFTINVDIFKRFLTRCMLSGLIKDLYLRGVNNALFACFDSNQNMYCEVYEDKVQIKTPGYIRIANIEQLVAVLSRVEVDASSKNSTKLVRIASTESLFVVTDGKKVGNLHVKLIPASGAEVLTSYANIKCFEDNPAQKLFSKEKLEYMDGNVKYTRGYSIQLASLMTILKDAKAFKMEIYKFYLKEGVLMCNIEDQTEGSVFIRSLPTMEKIGTIDIPSVVVSAGFRQMISTLEKEGELASVKIYFEKESILITDGLSFYYNLHNVTED